MPLGMDAGAIGRVDALDRLSRYDANLWRQAGRIILYALEMLDRRKPQERGRLDRYRTFGG
jgi:hypothetical protein